MKVFSVCGGILIFVIASFFASIYNGFVLSMMWKWFIVPTFGAPVIGLIPAVGISMLVGNLTYQKNDCECEKKENKGFVWSILEAFVYSVIMSSFTLFFGWIAHLFM